MKLFCSRCHTCWIESCLGVGQKCPFRDCTGWLTAVAPRLRQKPPRGKDDPTYPLLDISERQS